MKKIIALLFVTLLMSSCGSSKNEETPSHTEATADITTEETGNAPEAENDTETPIITTEETGDTVENKNTPEAPIAEISGTSGEDEETKTEDELVDETIQEIDDLFKLLESDDK